MSRPDWDLYFIRIAKEISSRSTCPRASVGVVITRNNRILATGYNGSPAGEPHCEDVGCDVVNGHCHRAVHAETNAIVQAAKFGASIDGATMYIYGIHHIDGEGFINSCSACELVIKAAGIKEVVVPRS